MSYAAPTYAAFSQRIGIVTSAAKEPLLHELRPYGERSTAAEMPNPVEG
ncbi:MAG: hypothetical protein OXG68_14340 [Chloroflexi bacterium]|nr:hypothetical protein [Chloroflexota bacterium]